MSPTFEVFLLTLHLVSSTSFSESQVSNDVFSNSFLKSPAIVLAHDSVSEEDVLLVLTPTRLLHASCTSYLQTLTSSGLRFVSQLSLFFRYIHCSPSNTTFMTFFDGLNSRRKASTSTNPQAEDLHIHQGNLNIYHRVWLKSSNTDGVGKGREGSNPSSTPFLMI